MAIFMALGIWCKEVRQACFTRNMSKSPNICENAIEEGRQARVRKVFIR